MESNLLRMSHELPTITLQEVSNHSQADDAWVAIKGYVYDVTRFLKFHPGGRGVLLRFAGTDCTEEYNQHHGDLVMVKYHKRFVIGKLPVKIKKSKLSRLAPIPLPNVFGELVPWGDPNWYQGWSSPYYNETHVKFRNQVREFCNKELIPNVHRWDESKKIPKTFLAAAAKVGVLQIIVGVGWPEKYCAMPSTVDIDPKDFDPFHELILVDEMSRCGSGGVMWGVCGGLAIGLPPVLNFGSEELKKRIVPDCLHGRKTICLAITEPWGGSDVANLTTTAKKSPCGKYYILNGEKKWITNGVFADYFTVACRTGGPGAKGVSFLVVERGPGVTTKQMNCMGVWASGTSYITFEDVKVPVENLVGKENKGFKIIMKNFNHERWQIVIQANRFARVCLEEALKFAQRRRAFGKLLIEQPVIRAKIAEMGRHITATHAALEDLTFQFKSMQKQLQPLVLGGHTAMLKVQATKTFEYCAREAAQILGGNSYTRGGQGAKVERLYREVRAYAIPGGSEEIMAELSVKQTLKVSKFVKKVIKINELHKLKEMKKKSSSKL